MISRYFQCVDLNVMPFPDFPKQFLYPLANAATEDPLSVFRSPCQVTIGESKRYGWSVV
jgi:hypothetical protein